MAKIRQNPFMAVAKAFSRMFKRNPATGKAVLPPEKPIIPHSSGGGGEGKTKGGGLRALYSIPQDASCRGAEPITIPATGLSLAGTTGQTGAVPQAPGAEKEGDDSIMAKNKKPMAAIELDTDERIVLAIMNLQVCIQNLMTTGDPEAALPALEESMVAIDPLATQILNKMTKQETPGKVLRASNENIIEFSKKVSPKGKA